MALEFYDILAEDHEIWAKRIGHEIHVTVRNEEDDVVYEDLTHPRAWESLVYLAKQVLAVNDRMEQVENAYSNNV